MQKSYIMKQFKKEEKNDKICILILNYKSTHETEQCVDSIENLEQEENDVQIIIVDNDSQDGCVEHFRKYIKEKNISI